MGAPITARLDDDTVAALDRAVAAGAAPTRAAVVAEAVREWLARHSEDAIAESYRRAYADPDPAHERLVGGLGAFSAAITLGDESGE
ncbi:MAG: ribbon-helix-helix protein, CopG family [Actinomycetota bacterium]|nr:ribbon-helix-helix protein, CopG family [Actinomycetota bacterium]